MTLALRDLRVSLRGKTWTAVTLIEYRIWCIAIREVTKKGFGNRAEGRTFGLRKAR